MIDDVAAANSHVAALVGTNVYAYRVANALALDFANDLLMTIETPISVTSTTGAWTGEPTSGGAIDVLLPLLYQTVVSAMVSADGSVRLTFDNGTIEVHPHPMYESWQLASQENWLVICVPGGGLALWTS